MYNTFILLGIFLVCDLVMGLRDKVLVAGVL